MKYKVYIEVDYLITGTTEKAQDVYSVVVEADNEDDAEHLGILEMKQEYKNQYGYRVEDVELITSTDTFDDWEEKYLPIMNPQKSEDDGFDSILFDTHDPVDIATVKGYDPKRVWTLLEGDNGTYVTSGMYFINRLGYYITSKPVEDEDVPKEYLLD